MGHQQTLHTIISIGGRVDNSFGRLGEELIVLGSQIDQISQKAITFGKESLKTYASYDDAMREAQAAGKFTAAEMERLDKLNRQIAQTSIYSNTEAANAMADLVKRGYELTEVEAMLPSVLDLAMAGNLELADSVDYLGTTLKALKEDAGYADDLADMMTVASDISASDIDTLGESIMRLGSGVGMFRGGAKEVLTLLTALSDFGEDMQGTQGGTLLRNFALSLIAPAGESKEVLAALENYGMTADELQDYMDEEGIETTAAAAAIKELGLDVFDANGELRSMYDILVDLDKALTNMPDSERIPILRQIFGRRGYTTAENLISILGDYWEIYNQIADSEGAAAERSGITQGGIGGAMREWTAAYEELKTSVGEQIAPEAIAGIDLMRGFMTDISNMDETALAALVGGLEGIAVIGPAITTAGFGMRLIGSFINTFGGTGATIAGGLMLSSIAIGALVSGLNKANEISFAENFGQMELDIQSLGEYVDGLSTKFETQQSQIAGFTSAIDTAAASYTTLTTELSKSLLEGVLTKQEFTEDETAALKAIGESAADAVKEGVKNAKAEALTITDFLFGDMESEGETKAFTDLVAWENSYYDGLYAQAQQIGEELRSRMTEALTDGELNEAERMAITASIDRLNAIQAEIAHAQNQEAYYEQKHKAQNVSFGSVEEFLKDNSGKMDSELASIDEWWHAAYGNKRAAFEYDLANGDADPLAWANIEAELNREYNDLIQDTISKYSDIEIAAINSLINGSDLKSAWDFVQNAGAAGIAPSYVDWTSLNEAAVNNLLALDDMAYKIIGILEPYSSNPAIAQMIGQLQSVSGYAAEALLYQQTDPSMGADFDTTGKADAAFAAMQAEFDAHSPLTAEAEIPGAYEDAAAYQSAVQAYLNANPVYANVRIRSNASAQLNGWKYFAEGGRADEPSIFGEAGAEWAIPETYSQRTAELLNAARAASGFSWPDLISRTSGSGSSGGTTQMVYAPTIYATDARDVEQKLMDDKARMEKWWEEKRLRDEIEVYR